jgi:very-short-patch-repair endonuclease
MGDTILEDMESILHLCTVSFPLGRLNWHYRSEHETLISVSNQEFYNNGLKVYPSPKERNDELGLHFEHTREGIYDRGRSRTNRVEATIVAQRVLDHYRSHPHLSLGVGTFNEAQRECILDEVEKFRRENPDVDKNFSRESREQFFVKNLETIQGDERDVIFISIGYGFDSDRVLNLNFGPLNQGGGERRLNVLISRARKKCVVFSNFEASDLTVGDNSSRGVQCLKVFLDYAQTGKLISDTTPPPFDSPFEESVHRFLAENKIVTHPQVGCAGYRIDLAVPHPTAPRQYLLGIECDGRPYHSSTVARERDRLRKQVLKDRGWTILNVWSTDWYLERSQAESRLLNKVQDAIERAHRSVEPLADPPVAEPEVEFFERDSSIAEPETSSNEVLSTEPDASGIDREKDITMPLLCFVYDNNGELRAGDSCERLSEYMFLAEKTAGSPEPPWPTNLTERIEWAANQLTNKGFLTKGGGDLWMITREGKEALAALGCT